VVWPCVCSYVCVFVVRVVCIVCVSCVLCLVCVVCMLWVLCVLCGVCVVECVSERVSCVCVCSCVHFVRRAFSARSVYRVRVVCVECVSFASE
jgi:hypothetical protein